MSLILFSVCAAVGAASASFLAMRRRKALPSVAGNPANANAEANTSGAAPDLPPREMQKLAGLPLNVGDVVAVEADDMSSTEAVRRKHQERWLTGAYGLFDGSNLLAAILFAPEGLKQEAVAAFAPPRSEIGWLSPTEVEIGPEPPPAIEIGGIVMQRRRRMHVRIERVGRGAAPIAASGTFAEYEASGRAMAIVLRLHDGVRAWTGTRYDASEYERWGSGGTR